MSDILAGQIVEEELIWGARRRERLWQILGLSGAAFGVLGCLAAAAVAILDVDPPPELVPFDPATGMALPAATVETTTLTASAAVIEAQLYAYVLDRETYNQLDNDVRIRRALSRSRSGAEASLRALWASGHEGYPPDRYGSDAELTVDILHISILSGSRAQVRLRKTLTSERGSQVGLFTATLAYGFEPETARALDEVWENPFGFFVKDYAIRSDRGG